MIKYGEINGYARKKALQSPSMEKPWKEKRKGQRARNFLYLEGPLQQNC